MLIEWDISRQRIGLRFEVVDQWLPIHFVNGDAGKVGDLDGVRARRGRRQKAIQLEVLAEGAPAAEHFISLLRLEHPRPIETIGIVRPIDGLVAAGFDRLPFLVTKPGSARNVALQQPPVMAAFSLEEFHARLRVRFGSGDREFERHHPTEIRFRDKQAAGRVFSRRRPNRNGGILVEPAGRRPRLKTVSADKDFTFAVQDRIRLKRRQSLPATEIG